MSSDRVTPFIGRQTSAHTLHCLRAVYYYEADDIDNEIF